MHVEVATQEWLLLVVSLPTANATARMRIWRAVKGLGCEALRDGAYLMPAGGEREAALQELAQECTRAGGTAWLMAVQPRRPGEEGAWRQLFDRGEAYAGLRKSWMDAVPTLAGLSSQELARLHRRLAREYEAVCAIDFFPGDAAADARAAWAEVERRLRRALQADEPHERAGAIPRLDPGAYRGRTWATRRRLWVDRVASAWLIRRFIDPDARFLWLAQPSDCPPHALGFDFDGAAFTHVGERVTFETLLAGFGLESDAALRRLAVLVHQLDVGGDAAAEAAGFEAVLAGARERLDDDDALLAEMGTVLDSLYAHFARAAAREK
ncbi:chromate resistance protein ChrB domain-containing protein [Azohydromonas lata]|uniref:Chromate resistance protein n=1 Tax=Azohydromonas lata TaxID=45677 RepID=A0ABU5IA10_9BURK|nr:chromate resistance protein ChrB domain-containing protein [Azohydromonas lata]MDZ5455936.1 chromate resistance protein [Azohydromonas lata]